MQISAWTVYLVCAECVGCLDCLRVFDRLKAYGVRCVHGGWTACPGNSAVLVSRFCAPVLRGCRGALHSRVLSPIGWSGSRGVLNFEQVNEAVDCTAAADGCAATRDCQHQGVGEGFHRVGHKGRELREDDEKMLVRSCEVLCEMILLRRSLIWKGPRHSPVG